MYHNCLCLLSVVVIKHHDQKQLRKERFYLILQPPLREVRAGAEAETSALSPPCSDTFLRQFRPACLWTERATVDWDLLQQTPVITAGQPERSNSQSRFPLPMLCQVETKGESRQYTPCQLRTLAEDSSERAQNVYEEVGSQGQGEQSEQKRSVSLTLKW